MNAVFRAYEGVVAVDGHKISGEYDGINIPVNNIIAYYSHDGEEGQGADITIITDGHTIEIEGYVNTRQNERFALGEYYEKSITELIEEPIGVNYRDGVAFESQNIDIHANVYNENL